MAPLVKDKKSFLAITLIIIGTLTFLHKMDIVDLPYWLISWPAILVWIGGFAYFTSDNRNSGLILMAIGGFFILQRYGWPVYFKVKDFWPLILVLAGILMLLKHKFSSSKMIGTENTYHADGTEALEDRFNETAIFGGGEHKIISDNFKGGSITAIFGGSKIDLSEAELAEGTSVIEATALFGGWELIVPAHWKLSIDVTPILGGFSDNRKVVVHDMADNTRQLIIKGFVMFGGGDVKSVTKS